MLIRIKKKVDFRNIEESDMEQEDISSTELDEMMDLFSMDEIIESLEQLPIQQRTIFNLYAIDELTHPGPCSRDTARSAYYLGLQVGWRAAQRLR